MRKKSKCIVVLKNEYFVGFFNQKQVFSSFNGLATFAILLRIHYYYIPLAQPPIYSHINRKHSNPVL